MSITPTACPRDALEPLREIRLGSVCVYPLVQLHYRVDPERFFPDIARWPIDENDWYWAAPFIEDGALVIDMGGFLVRTPDRTILIDAGIGNDKDRPNPAFHRRSDSWLDLLPRAGVATEDVDTVLFTHLHVDHVGFATTLRDGRWVPTFTNATYRTTAAELDYWTGPDAAAELERLGDYIADSVLPLADANVLEITPPDAHISDEVRLLPAPGHTPGNVSVEVRSEGRRAVFTGDMIHHALQLAFPWRSTDYCVDEERATVAREALLQDLAPEDLLFPAHFPHSSPGLVRRTPPAGYRFLSQPGEPI